MFIKIIILQMKYFHKMLSISPNSFASIGFINLSLSIQFSGKKKGKKMQNYIIFEYVIIFHHNFPNYQLPVN